MELFYFFHGSGHQLLVQVRLVDEAEGVRVEVSRRLQVFLRLHDLIALLLVHTRQLESRLHPIEHQLLNNKINNKDKMVYKLTVYGLRKELSSFPLNTMCYTTVYTVYTVYYCELNRLFLYSTTHLLLATHLVVFAYLAEGFSERVSRQLGGVRAEHRVVERVPETVEVRPLLLLRLETLFIIIDVFDGYMRVGSNGYKEVGLTT